METIELRDGSLLHCDDAFLPPETADGYFVELREGNWYRLEEPPMEGWLCPAMFRYFEEAPAELYLKAEEIK